MAIPIPLHFDVLCLVLANSVAIIIDLTKMGKILCGQKFDCVFKPILMENVLSENRGKHPKFSDKNMHFSHKWKKGTISCVLIAIAVFVLLELSSDLITMKWQCY